MLSKQMIDIHQIVKPSKFQQIQDDIAVATGLAIITVDYKGIPVTTHSKCCDFCKKMRASDVYRLYCEKCDSRGGLEAARIHKPFIYFCHAGLIDLAIPIIVDNLYLGAFMAGQVLLEEGNDAVKLEQVGVGKTIDFSKDPALRWDYSKLPIMNLEKIEALANMLQHIGNYCVKEALLKATITQLHSKKRNPANSDEERDIEIEDDRTGPLDKTKGRMPSKVLQPALEYIRHHPDERITLTKMATLCNISASYFSKLFAKENYGSLSNYVNHFKVEKAKELLLNTDWSIRNIADELGFDDCSYFIKVFKSEAGMTPDEFRRI